MNWFEGCRRAGAPGGAISNEVKKAGQDLNRHLSTGSLSLSQARRIALAAQGFDRPRPRGRVDVRHVRRTILGLGLVQIDYVNVLIPAQYQIPFSRLGPYDRGRLDDLVYRRQEFTEQWAHEASIVPIQHWPLFSHRRDTHRVRPWGFEKFLEAHPDYVSQVLETVRRQGPLTADDLPEPPARPQGQRDQWGWAKGVRRQVLEAQFGFGRLAVADRLSNFQRVYDLAERIVPQRYRDQVVSKEKAGRLLLLQAARAQGIGLAGDLADYYRMSVTEARPRLQELVEEGSLEIVDVEGWKQPAYLHPESKAPRDIAASALLSPFDPVVWTRPRVKRLFDFDYRLEIWVPRRKRKWGYYVLPFLLGERLTARVDLKADRKSRRLNVLSAYLEPHADSAPVVEALARELRLMAGWLELEAVSVGERGDLAGMLRRAVESRSG